MKKKAAYERITKSPLLRNILTLFSGKVAAQIILIGSAPIIARLFNPGDFGIAALVLAIATMVGPLATLSYGTAAQLTDRDTDARALLRLTMASTVFFSLVMTAIIFLLTQTLDTGLIAQLSVWIWVIPLLFFLTGVVSALESWNTRMKQFRIQASTSVSEAAVGTGSRICFGMIGGSSVAGLVIGYLLGLGTRITILARASTLHHSSEKKRTDLGSYRKLMVRYRDFPIFATPTAMLNTLTNKLPLLLFGVLFSPTIAGIYAMADRLYFRPLLMFQGSFRSVYTQHLITALNMGRPITPILLKGFFSTGAIMFLPAVLLTIYGEPVVAWLLSEKWRAAGVFIEITAPLMIFASLAVPGHAAMVVCRKQGRLLILQVVTTATLVIGFIVSFLMWGTPEATLRTFVFVLALRHLYTVFVAFVVSSRRDRNVLGEPEKRN
jgi:O-antigen/teichoic acid export membrane protein